MTPDQQQLAIVIGQYAQASDEINKAQGMLEGQIYGYLHVIVIMLLFVVFALFYNLRLRANR
jgi:hypothetical protein